MPRNILYMFSADWNHELVAYARGEVPSHRLFGFIELQKLGLRPFTCPTPPVFRKRLSRGLSFRIYQALFAVFRQPRIDCIFAVNEATAMPLLVLKRLGLLRTPVIVFCTGLMHPRNRTGKRFALWRWVLPSADAVVSQTSMEYESSWREFGLRQDRQALIHMLVDVDFFRPDLQAEPAGDFCLAVGTNQGRDYPTLLKAFPREQKLIIITDAYNADIVQKHLEPGMQVQVLQNVPIEELRHYYKRAKVIINPLAEIAYCSGHTVLLENMALGRPIIISGVGGMKDYLVDGSNALVVRPNDPEHLRQVLAEFLKDPARFDHIGKQAAQWARRFSTTNFAIEVNKTIERLIAGRVGADPPARAGTGGADHQVNGVHVSQTAPAIPRQHA